MNAREYADQVCSKLRDAGHLAYLVGGCVRDMLMGRVAKDYDVTTSATPDQVLRLFPDALTPAHQVRRETFRPQPAHNLRCRFALRIHGKSLPIEEARLN